MLVDIPSVSIDWQKYERCPFLINGWTTEKNSSKSTCPSPLLSQAANPHGKGWLANTLNENKISQLKKNANHLNIFN